MTNLGKNVKWSFNVSVDGGPLKTLSQNFDVEAVDSLNLTIPKNTSADMPVELQPGISGRVKLLCIRGSIHNDVSYKLSDGTKDSGSVILDTDHILNSSNVLGLIGVDPKLIKFQNKNANADANIDIIVARKVF